MKTLKLLLLLGWMSSALYGQTLVKDIYPGAQSSNPKILGALNGKLIFMASTDIQGYELWISDGTEAGTSRLKDLRNDKTKTLIKGSDLQVDSIIYFSIHNSDNTNSLWRTDGTADGTIKLFESAFVSALADRSTLFAYKNRVFFTGHDTINGDELWVTDGTVQGTKLFYDINKIPGKGSYVIEMTSFKDQLYFKADDGIHGYELWTSDGVSNTHLFVDLCPGWRSSLVDYGYGKHIIQFKDYLYFTGRKDSMSGIELFRTDGTDSGTKLFRDFNRIAYKSSYPRFNSVSDQFITFYVYDSSSSYVLFRTDGFHAGTYRIGDDKDYPIGLLVSDFYKTLNNKTFFGICTQNSGCEFWMSNGYADGTKPIMDINSGFGNSITDQAIVYRNQIIFAAIHQSLGRELWITDGTNTRLLIETMPGNLLSNFLDMHLIGDVLYYSGTTNNNMGIELYKLNLQQLLSINANTKTKLAIWPNPLRAGDILKLGLNESMTYYITDLSGRTIQSGISQGDELPIDAGISYGLYILTIETPQGLVSQKVQISQ